MYFSNEGNGESRRLQSNDEIAKLKASVEKLKSDVKTLQRKTATVQGFEKYDKEQIGFLEEYLKAVEDIHSGIQTKFQFGTVAFYTEAEARFQFHRAKARLAQEKGSLALSQKEYEKALKAAEDHAEARDLLLQSFTRGLLPLHQVVRAHSEVLETKLSLSRIKKLIQRTQKQ